MLNNKFFKKRAEQRDFLTGFTIIELLVVISIAAFILSITVALISGARTRGRDARREEEIKQTQNALDIYHVNRRQYPVCALDVIDGANDCLTAALVADSAISFTPTDPLGRASGECLIVTSYVYCYESDGDDYTLHYHLETDSILGKSAGWQEARP